MLHCAENASLQRPEEVYCSFCAPAYGAITDTSHELIFDLLQFVNLISVISA